MNAPQINLDHLASRLEPIIASIRKDGIEFAETFGSELSKKTSGGLIGLAYSAARSLGKAAWTQIRSSRAHRRFSRNWDGSASSNEREKAVRKLLEEDPRLAKSLYGLLVRRDFVRAVVEHAEHLPNIGLLDSARRLSEIYVPLRIQPIAPTAIASDKTKRSETSEPPASRMSIQREAVELLRSGNHLLEGAPGSGKSTLARQLVISEARRLLESNNTISLDQVRLPILTTARSLQAAQTDISSALHQSVSVEMSFSSLGSLPDQFFVPYSDAGHKLWLVVVDGLDEVPDRHERQRLWDAISRLHSQAGDAFRFIIFTRPDAIRVRSEQSNFQRWSMRPLTSSDRTMVAHRYIQQSELAEKFLSYIRTGTFIEICDTPLFEAIAASVFSKTGELPNTKIALCEAFIDTLLEKSSIADFPRHSVLRLLTIVAVDPRVDLSLKIYPELAALLPRNLPRLGSTGYLEDVLRRSGIVRIVDGAFSFFHDSFRSYFLSLHLAEIHRPNATVWKTIDPFAHGWTTLQYLCEAWEQAGEDISDVVSGLLAFGDGGQNCATEISISCLTVKDKIVGKIADRIFREMYSTGATISGLDALTRLARHRTSVKSRLIEATYSRRSFMESKLECAECLVDAGHLTDGLKALRRIAQDDDEYQWDRIRAAELLLKHGQREVAQEVLLEITENGEQLSTRGEAACILFENARTDENRELVTRLLKEEPLDEFDQIYESTIAKLLSLGEKDITLPAMRERAKPPENPGALSSLPREQIEAARAIATYHDKKEGIDALKFLLDWRHISIRGKAEVIDALGDIEEDEARKLLIQLVGDGPEYEGADWFLLEMLPRYGLEDKLRSVGLYLLHAGLNSPSLDCLDIVKRISPFFDRDELAEPIRTRLHVVKNEWLAICLATLGFRSEAVGFLKSWINRGDIDLEVDSALALCRIGERQAGIRILNRIVKDRHLRSDKRLRAASALERADEVGASDKAYLILLRDPYLSISDRCQAARHFDEDGIDRADVIWKVLFPYVTDVSNSIKNRVVAAKELFTTTEPEWSDFEHSDVTDELFSILESKDISRIEAWSIIGALAETGFSLSGIPGALELADDDRIPATVRIEVLSSFVLKNNAIKANEQLIKIANAAETSYSAAIDALSRAHKGGQPLLDSIARDLAVPPKWRLKAASSKRGRDFLKNSSENAGYIILDDGVTIQERLAALKEVSKSLTPTSRLQLLSEMANASQIGNWDRLLIAKAALEAEGSALAEALMNDALGDEPHSIAEMAHIAEILHDLGDERRARAKLLELAAVPDTILRESDDLSDLAEAAQLLSELGHPAEATNFLFRILELASWYDVCDVLDAIGEVAGQDKASEAATSLFLKLASVPSESANEYLGSWRRTIEELLAKGWTSDLEPLLVVANDLSKSLSDQAEAAAVIYRNSWRDSTQDWSAVAQRVLLKMLQRDLQLSERIELISIMCSAGLRKQARQEIDKIAVAVDFCAADCRAIAKVLSDLGDEERAKVFLSKITDDDEAGGSLAPWDERLVESLQGKEKLALLREKRIFNDEEPLFDRLLEARQIVSEYGDKRALFLIQSTADDIGADPNDRLGAIEVLNDLGYREVSRRLISEVVTHPEIDDYWAGDLLLQFGRKSEALKYFRRSINSCPPGYRDQIARRLADLQAVDLLRELDSQEERNSTSVISPPQG